MKFIRDLIEEKSRSIQERQNDKQDQAEGEDPNLGIVPLQEVSRERPRKAFTVPVATLPEATAKMDDADQDDWSDDADLAREAQADLGDLDDLRRALATSDEVEPEEMIEDATELSGMDDYDDVDDDDHAEDHDDASAADVEMVEDEPAEEPVEMQQPDLSVEDSEPAEPEMNIADAAPEPLDVPSPAAGRSSRQSGRVKTRILGFSSPNSTGDDPFEKASENTSAQVSKFPVGWLAVIDGPGRGSAFTIFDGVAQIGRGEDQAVRLDFGDNSISRQNHAAIAYDNEQKSFFLGHGGKANLVRLNGRPVLSTEELRSEDTVRIGETTLRFIAMCGEGFSWDQEQEDEARNASVG